MMYSGNPRVTVHTLPSGPSPCGQTSDTSVSWTNRSTPRARARCLVPASYGGPQSVKSDPAVRTNHDNGELGQLGRLPSIPGHATSVRRNGTSSSRRSTSVDAGPPTLRDAIRGGRGQVVRHPSLGPTSDVSTVR